MTRFRAALAVLLATLVALMFATPAQAAGNAVTAPHVNHGHHYGQLKKFIPPPPPAPIPPPPAPAPPPPAPTNVVFNVDGTHAGSLPVGDADAGWSYNTHVTLVGSVGCSGNRCIRVVIMSVTECGTTAAGCSVSQPDGSCNAEVTGGFGYVGDRNAIEHEIGHCLGLAHNTADPTSIMQPILSLTLPGPDDIDRANVRALYP